MKLYAVIKANRTGVVVEEGNGLLKRNDNIQVFDLYAIQRQLLLITADHKSLELREFTTVKFSVPKKYRESIYQFMIGKKNENIIRPFEYFYKIDMSWIKGKAKYIVIDAARENVHKLGVKSYKQINNHEYLYLVIRSDEEYYFGWLDNKVDFDRYSYCIEVGINDVLNCKSFKDLLSMAENKNRKR